MQARTKKRPIENVEVRFIGPIVNMAKAIENLKPLGFVDMSDSVPWRDAYPECNEAELIGKALAGARYREGLTQTRLAELTGFHSAIFRKWKTANVLSARKWRNAWEKP